MDAHQVRHAARAAQLRSPRDACPRGQEPAEGQRILRRRGGLRHHPAEEPAEGKDKLHRHPGPAVHHRYREVRRLPGVCRQPHPRYARRERPEAGPPVHHCRPGCRAHEAGRALPQQRLLLLQRRLLGVRGRLRVEPRARGGARAARRGHTRCRQAQVVPGQAARKPAPRHEGAAHRLVRAPLPFDILCGAERRQEDSHQARGGAARRQAQAGAAVQPGGLPGVGKQRKQPRHVQPGRLLVRPARHFGHLRHARHDAQLCARQAIRRLHRSQLLAEEQRPHGAWPRVRAHQAQRFPRGREAGDKPQGLV